MGVAYGPGNFLGRLATMRYVNNLVVKILRKSRQRKTTLNRYTLIVTIIL